MKPLLFLLDSKVINELKITCNHLERHSKTINKTKKNLALVKTSMKILPLQSSSHMKLTVHNSLAKLKLPKEITTQLLI